MTSAGRRSGPRLEVSVDRGTGDAELCALHDAGDELGLLAAGVRGLGPSGPSSSYISWAIFASAASRPSRVRSDMRA